MGKREEDQGARLIRCGTGLLLGGVLALAVCCLFLLGCAAAVSGGLAGEELGYQFTIVGCVLGGFSGGLLAVKRCGCGLLAGLGRTAHRRRILAYAHLRRNTLLRQRIGARGAPPMIAGAAVAPR